MDSRLYGWIPGCMGVTVCSCAPGDGLYTGAGRACASVHVQPCRCGTPEPPVGVAELKEAAETSAAQCRSEKQRRKQLELRLSSLEEEVQDLRTEKESLDQVPRLQPLTCCCGIIRM